jgi:deoxyribodipyrimidine photolyase
MNSKIGIVWFKRDLRLTDHAPLDAAEQSGLPLLYLWIIEPSEWAAPENSLRHWQFQWHSIQQINQLLEPFNRKITVVYGEAKEDDSRKEERKFLWDIRKSEKSKNEGQKILKSLVRPSAARQVPKRKQAKSKRKQDIEPKQGQLPLL